MAYSEATVARVRTTLGPLDNLREQKMFGGLAFIHRGNMLCGIMGDELMLRLGPELGPQTAIMPNVRLMDFTGKIMKTMVIVSPQGFVENGDLTTWLTMAKDFCDTLPEK